MRYLAATVSQPCTGTISIINDEMNRATLIIYYREFQYRDAIAIITLFGITPTCRI
jgi:hypothetical protein